MAVFRYYPTKDATLYESSPSTNTGLDPILEMQNTPAVGSTGAAATSSYVSRILLDFDFNTIASQWDSSASLNDASNKFVLKLYTTEPQEIPLNYTVEARPLALSWNMGIGRASNVPLTTEGVSWQYRQGENIPATPWPTSSFPAGTTGSWNINPGGGLWYTGSVATQSFNYTTTDLEIDITSLITPVVNNTRSFYGIVVKRSSNDEQYLGADSSLKFYSKDTNTIFSPVLEIRTNDYSASGSVTPVDGANGDFNILLPNLQSAYKEGSRPRIDVVPRYRYPTLTYSTSSAYLSKYRLPTAAGVAQYAIYLAKSDDVIINFSDYTKISYDSNGNYFNLDLKSFQPEQYYRILIRVAEASYNGNTVYSKVIDNNFVFKVERNQPVVV